MNVPPHPALPGGLYALCDDGIRPQLSLEQKAQLLLAGGVKVIQVRIKQTPQRQALDELARISERCRAAGAVCLANDRVDWALIAGAGGAHVGDDDLPGPDARRALGPGRILGVTVRDAASAAQACADGADYVGVGPVFATATKQVPAALLGVAGLRALVQASRVPVVAIAGITLDNIGQIAATGAHGAAVLSDLLMADDIPARARALAAAFERGAVGRSLLP
jgi:thiamine-phosphate pyrophosphorylase